MSDEVSVFSIENSDKLDCMVEFYVLGHSEMCIRASSHDGNRTIYLVFRFVEYFSGPFHWKGTTFRLGTPDECLHLFRTLKQFSDFPDDIWLDRFKLYIGGKLTPEIKVVAATAYLRDKL